MRSPSARIALLPAVFALGSESSSFTFEWPYSASHGCVCTDVASHPENGVRYESEGDCVAAFGESPYEYCSAGVNEDGSVSSGLDEEECENAVTVALGISNGDCRNKCTSVVAGVLSLEDFLSVCRLEYVVDFGEAGVAPINDAASCFSNYVYGWATYDPSNLLQAPPLRIFHDVPTAALCQDLCQKVDGCASFNWMAEQSITPYQVQPDSVQPESVQSESIYDHKGLTCLLYSEAYMQAVLEHTIEADDELEGPSPYCNVHRSKHCPLTPQLFSQPEQESCLFCECEPKCVWKEARHITGPAFCQKDVNTDECAFSRPSWTTTPPPCTDPETTDPETTDPETETSTEQGTANTDTELTETHTTNPELSTDLSTDLSTTHPEGTAVTDTETTHPDDHTTTDDSTQTTISLSETETQTTISLSETETQTTVSLSDTTATETTVTLSATETGTGLTETGTAHTGTTDTGMTETETSECECGECPCLDEGMDDSVPDDNDDCFECD